MDEKKIVRSKKEKKIIPEINEKQNYLFLFNENFPEKDLRNQKCEISGEFVNIFLKQNYGVLC
jgi:hypothetical protein